MRSMIWLVTLVVSFSFAGTVLAADGAAIYKAKCAACHGQKGEGMKGMAPAQKGNDFITSSKPEDVKKVILEGRAGAAKKYKEYPIDMPKNPMPDADADALVKFLQGGLQK